MSSTAEKEFQKLFEQSKRIRTLEGVIYLLDWDQETQMPEGAAEARGDQLKIMSGLLHEEKVSRRFSDPLSKLIDLKTGKILASKLSEPKKAAVREWRRDYMIDNALPKKFVEDTAKLCSTSITVWRDARKNNNFKTFAPYLKKVVAMNQKKADLIGYKSHPYDALLDLYEPGMTTDVVSKLFNSLKKSLVPLLKKIAAAPQIDDRILYGDYPEDKQLALMRKLLPYMGYDLKKGRLDLSTHPFSSSPHPTDSRITTRIQPDLVFNSISTVLHEGGHSLYEMGLPIDSYGSPLGQSISMGVHESQSRFWETRIGQSRPFWEFFLPMVKEAFPAQLQYVDVEKCYRAVNKVEPSFIRVEADEVTYPLHVILRFELEKALIEGSLSVNDVPDAWNKKMKELLGITPPNDAKGCLQDIHWSMGAFGYFPTYAIGNLYAAQLFTLFTKKNPKWSEKIAKGDMLFVRDFLEQSVYRYGKQYKSQELIKKVTGHAFSADDYVDYLNSKYTAIYNLKGK